MNHEIRAADDPQIPVLIVRGALVGLSMSLFLAWQGIPSLLVEKHPEPARLPRARGYNERTYVRMNCGHAIALDAPDKEAREILTWIDEYIQ